MPNPNADDNVRPQQKTLSAFIELQSLMIRTPLMCTLFITTGALAEHAPQQHTASATTYKTTTRTAAQTDWQARDQLTPEQISRLKPACYGIYVDPFADKPTPDPANTLIEVDAGAANMNTTHIELSQGVHVRQGARIIEANAMSFDKETEQASLRGHVMIRQTGSLILGHTASVNMIANEAEFTDGSFVIHAQHLRGTAGRLAHASSGKLVLENGTFTSCEPNDKSWLLSGKKLTLDPDAQQGYGRDVVIRIAGIPVLYTPYIRFPLGSERQTGLLTPSIGTVDGGLDFAQPWYWNIAPNQDATITPRYVNRRGAMLEAEYRYLAYTHSNQVQFSALPNDRGGDNANENALIATGKATEQELRPHKGDSRWLMQFDHEGGRHQPWYSAINYGRVSDTDFLRDLPAASFNVANETYMTQNARVGYDFANWHVSANFYNAQNLLTDIDDSYRRLPQLQAEGNYRLGDFGASLYHEFVAFDHRQEQKLNGQAIITGERTRLDYQLHYQRDTSWGFIKPSIGAQGMSYNLDKDELKATANSTPTLSTHYASFDSGLIFEHASGRQSLEPRLFYFFRQYTDHSSLLNVTYDNQSVNFDTSPLTFSYNQLFRPHRFTGGDRLDDANQMTLGLTHRYLRENGQPLWDISVGQLFYFDDRKVGLNATADTAEESDLAGQFSVNLTENLRTLGSAQFNPKTNKLMRANIGTHFTHGDWLLNIDYRYAREQTLNGGSLSQKIDQLDVSFYLPTSNQWRLIGRSFYDLDEKRELETFVGFEYDACCYRLRTVARRWLDAKLASGTEDTRRPYDQGLFFEIELMGLGSSGKRIESLLKDSIFGYQDKQ
ncbi:LPS-assembly protein LptD [Marinagarivorans algicola]|uniref:LPS-assembly protein LptD n=1 Tax=Marinagarivorans algicola TaxID=1513270 RepID=UPI00155D9E21|nr:LPS assembly protein LptD [Marinagarivorans algicola]